ncbi:MAG: hypothetical protein GY839_07800, partial [candidate division Zixibacteria bacterium]|nr:hypothetical protein [candidate division Zixibacteria bacterium]
MWKNILIPIFVLVLLGCFMGGAAASDVKLPTPPSKFNPGEHGYKPVYKDNWRGAKDVTLKWSQMPDLDPTGMDVADYNNPPYPPYLLADDFECTTTGPITDITIWGSWWQDYLPNQDPLSVTFTVSIHADIPAADNPYGAYSMPGETLWLGTPETVVADIFFIGQEGWFEPPDSYDPLGDTQCWMYSFHFDQPFIQQGTPDIPIVYWVDIQAQPHDPNAFFGWKTSIDHWNDDAAWTISEEPIPGGDPPWQWFELRYPPGHPWEPQSIDLAFEIYGEEEEPPLGACCYPDGSCINLDQTNCLQSGGVWAGAGSMCMGDSDGNYIDDACEGFYPTGACCFPDLSCIVTYQPACEIVAGGTYKGDGTDCSDTSPPNGIADICETQQTMGACCLPDGSCVMMDQVSCEALVGAWYVGDNIFCQGDFNSNGIDDICESDTTVKWDQLPDLDPTGMDVSAFNHPQFPPFILADDFPCTQTGPITRIEIWGSWWQDQMPIDPPAFVISFHRDIPADENPYGHWSMPGELLWLDTLYIYDQLLYAENLEEGWFEPPSSYDPIGDTQCWMYRFYEFDQPFIQEGTPEDTVIYWLDVQILLPLHETAFFGWKTSLDHWNDDAVWIQAIEPLPPDPPPMWNELRYPDLHPMHPQSIDLAFRIFGEAGPLTGACCFPDGSCLDLNAGDCANAAGVWGGPGTFCMGDGDGNFIDDACEGYYPTGACCFPDQSCMVTYQPACVIAGGTYMGDGTDCTDGDGNLIADICEEDTLFKWQQFPDLEPTGIDVCASNQWILGQWLLADDFLCTQYGPITEIKVW